jgi:RND family efflux transporter MFP subunit
VTRAFASIARWPRRRLVLLGVTIAGLVLLIVLKVGSSSADALGGIETAEVTRGDFQDTLTIRGEIKAVRSRTINAPAGAGDLTITRLARSGSTVKQGDVVVEFDQTKVLQTLAEKRTALRQADAEIAKAHADARLTNEATRTEQVKGQYDIERAKLDVGTRDVVSKYDAAKAELTLSDAQQRAREVEARLGANEAATRATTQGLINKRNKAAADVQLAESQLARLTVRAPVNGLFMVTSTWRGPMGESEFREGDRAWAGSVVAEIPDPSSLYIAARVDEADRGRLKPAMTATVLSDAVPGLELPAKLTTFSKLARPDFSTWPPPRLFDVSIDLDTPDPRLKPGMSTSIRVAVDRLEQTLLIPSRALVQTDAQALVYVAGRRGFEARPVVVARRGQAQVAIASGLEAGERIALSDPTKQPSAAPAAGAGTR